MAPSRHLLNNMQEGEEALSEVRRVACKDDLQRFCRLYLPHHFNKKPSKMHHELYALLEEASMERQTRLAIAAPRANAKTTLVSLAYLLWSMAYEREDFIVILSNTSEQATQILSDLKKELEGNEQILKDFPNLAEPPGRRPSPKRWRQNEIETRNGIKVLALGAGQSLRGRKHGQHRPSLVVLDDVEGEMDAHSQEVREQRSSWFQKAVLNAGSPERTNFILVGTVIHFDSLLANLIGIGKNDPAPGWISRKYQAIVKWAEDTEGWIKWEGVYTKRLEYEGLTGKVGAQRYFEDFRDELLEGTEVLWPEHESYLALMEMRISGGRSSFDSEKQNEPVDAENCLFDIDSIDYWDDEFSSERELFKHLGMNAALYGACDPSLGKKGRKSDCTAVITIAADHFRKQYYVLDVDISRRKPHETLNVILAFHERRRYTSFTMETNQFQDFLADELIRKGKQRNRLINVRKINHTTNKLARIQSLEPLIASGTLRFSRKHQELLDQLRQFPYGAHDDGPDALEMALTVARTPVPSVIVL